MTTAIISDPHLISPDDPHEELSSRRSHFAAGWPSFRRMLERLEAERVDRVVVLGDLVDYYSDENRDFALSLLEELSVPWHLTPGNHDLAVPTARDGETITVRDEDAARAGWRDAGVDLDDLAIDDGDVRFLLVDSATSAVRDGAGTWLDANLDGDRYCVLCTHVPLDRPTVVECITDVDPDRDLDKYVQRGSPDLFDRHLRGRTGAVFSGHLHFPGVADVGGTRQHILPPCVHADRRSYDGQGTAALLDPDDPGSPRFVRIPAEAD